MAAMLIRAKATRMSCPFGASDSFGRLCLMAASTTHGSPQSQAIPRGTPAWRHAGSLTAPPP